MSGYQLDGEAMAGIKAHTLRSIHHLTWSPPSWCWYYNWFSGFALFQFVWLLGICFCRHSESLFLWWCVCAHLLFCLASDMTQLNFTFALPDTACWNLMKGLVLLLSLTGLINGKGAPVTPAIHNSRACCISLWLSILTCNSE